MRQFPGGDIGQPFGGRGKIDSTGLPARKCTARLEWIGERAKEINCVCMSQTYVQ